MIPGWQQGDVAAFPSHPPLLTPSSHGVTAPDLCICHLTAPNSPASLPGLSAWQRSLEHSLSSPSKWILAPHFITKFPLHQEKKLLLSSFLFTHKLQAGAKGKLSALQLNLSPFGLCSKLHYAIELMERMVLRWNTTKNRAFSYKSQNLIWLEAEGWLVQTCPSIEGKKTLQRKGLSFHSQFCWKSHLLFQQGKISG